MSMLRSVLFEEFPYVDNWAEQHDIKASVHIAHSGFGHDLIHVGIDDGFSEGRINIGVEMAQKIVDALQGMIDNYWTKEICDE